MTEIKPIQSTQIPCSALTQDDITRLPKNSVSVAANQAADTFESEKQESHALRNTIIGIILAAGAIVGLKHCSFMKFDANDAGFMTKYIKKPISTLGGWIEWPFVKVAKMIKGEKGETPKAPDTPPKAPETP